MRWLIHALGTPWALRDRNHLVLEGKIATRRGAGVEMLMEPAVGWDDHGALLPVIAARLFALRPHQRVALAAHDDHVRPGTVAMRFLIGGDRELRDMAVHRALGHVEADVAAAGAALLGLDQRQVDGVGDEVGLQQQTLLLALVGEIVRLAGEAVLEVVARVEYELDIVIEVDDRGPVGDGHVACRPRALAVEMLVPAVDRNGEQRALVPLEGDLLTRIVPNAGRAAPVQYVDHFLEQLALRLELAAARESRRYSSRSRCARPRD